jgi:hypothetical protein
VNLDQASRGVKSGYKKNILICLPNIILMVRIGSDSRKYSNKLFAHRGPASESRNVKFRGADEAGEGYSEEGGESRG